LDTIAPPWKIGQVIDVTAVHVLSEGNKHTVNLRAYVDDLLRLDGPRGADHGHEIASLHRRRVEPRPFVPLVPQPPGAAGAYHDQPGNRQGSYSKNAPHNSPHAYIMQNAR